ncbi:MAG: hypothetical protein HOW73_49465 [Polyangiaceae bacterium]|nr:hypothetical protein [Polyangiaceae bacterium]
MVPHILPDFCSAYSAPVGTTPAVDTPDSTIPVINVVDYLDPSLFGHPGTPLSPAEAREAIRRAAEDIPDGGGILYFPEGLYEIESHACAPIAIKSGTWVRGAGRGAVLRNLTPGGILLWIFGVSDVRVSDLVFDINHGECAPPTSISVNYATAIASGSGTDIDTDAFLATTNLTIENCVFKTSGDAIRGQTLHAILAQGVDGLFVRRNHIIGMQIKAAGADGSTRIVIEDNFIESPHNLAISAVVSTTVGTVVDVSITGNVVVDVPSAGGFFLGTDGEGTPGALLGRVMIRNNVIRGVFAAASGTIEECVGEVGVGAAGAMIIDIPVTGVDLLIQDNVVDNTAPTAAVNSTGIVVKASTLETSFLRSVLITGNLVRRFDHGGILLACSCETAIIEGNHLEQDRGIQIGAGPGGISQLVVANNRIQNLGQGIQLAAVQGSIRRALVEGNIISNPSGVGSVKFTGIDLVAGVSGGVAHSLSVDAIGNRVSVDAAYSYRIWGILERHDTSGAGVFGRMRYLDNVLPTAFGATPLERLGTTAVVHRNKGYATRTTGSSAIAAGTTSVAVPHGLPAAPAQSDIRLTLSAPPPGSWGTAGIFWVSAANATSFTVQCASAPASGQSVSFVWQATLP